MGARPSTADAPQNTASFRQRPRLTRPIESYNVHSRNSDQLWAPLNTSHPRPGLTEKTRSERINLPTRPNGPVLINPSDVSSQTGAATTDTRPRRSDVSNQTGNASTYDARPRRSDVPGQTGAASTIDSRPRRSDTAKQPVHGVPETIQRRHSGSQLEASSDYLIGTAGRLGQGSQTTEQLQAQLTALRSQLRQVTSKIHQQKVIVENLEKLVNTSTGSNRTTNVRALTEATTELQRLRVQQSQLELNIHTIETKLSSHNR